MASVYRHRQLLGLQKRRRVKKFVWTKAADRFLRTNSPLAAAELLKLSKRTINLFLRDGSSQKSE
jgi:hypothetical protein